MSLTNELKYRAFEVWLKVFIIFFNYIGLPAIEISKILIDDSKRETLILVSNSVFALIILLTFSALYYKLNKKFHYEF